MLEQIRGLYWPVNAVPMQSVGATHWSRRYGPSSELSEYRPYRQGDEVGKIDWKLLARTDRAYIRLAQEHSIASANIYIDANASMAWPTDTLSKWHHAKKIALGLSSAIRTAGDPLGLLISGGETNLILEQESRQSTLAFIAAHLNSVVPGGRRKITLPIAANSQHRLVLISDFLHEVQDLEQLVTLCSEICYRGGEVIAIHVVADEELNPRNTPAVLSDVEAPDIKRNLSASAIGEYQRRFDAWRQDVATRFRRTGTHFYVTNPSSNPATEISRIVRGVA